MARWVLGLAMVAGVGVVALGQVPAAGYGYQAPPPAVTYPAAPPGGFMPNYYSRTTQPLSPYLNLFRGTIPSVDYYFGIRPGLQAGAQPGGGFGVPMLPPTGSRPGYLPLEAAAVADGVAIPAAGLPLPNNQLYQTGRPAVFGPGPGLAPPGAGSARPGFTRAPTIPPPRRSLPGVGAVGR
jgi:hypothetical protein